MGVLTTIGKVIGGIILIGILAVVGIDWMAGQRDKAFAQCKLTFLQTHPNGDIYTQQAFEFLETCMAASGYKFDYHRCNDPSMRTADSCYYSGYIPY